MNRSTPFAAATLLCACAPEIAVRSPLVADAGADLDAPFTDTVRLSGGAALEPAAWAWSLVLAPPDSAARIEADDQRIATLRADFAGLYVVRLVVGDGRGSASAPDYKNVVLRPSPGSNPAVSIEPPSAVQEGKLATLKGRVIDPTGTPVAIRWIPAATNFAIVTPDVATTGSDTTATFTAPPLPAGSERERLHFTLVATNRQGGSSRATAEVDVTRLPVVDVAVQCPACRPGPAADEQADVALTVVVRTSGATVSNVAWGAAVRPGDAAAVSGDPAAFTLTALTDATWRTPTVYRTVTIDITARVSAAGYADGTANFPVQVPNTIDEPPLGSLTVTPRATPVLLGDAVDLLAAFTDPNGDPVSGCTFTATRVVLVVPSAISACTATLYPFEGGDVDVTASATALNVTGRTAPVRIAAVSTWQVEAAGTAITAIAPDGQNQAVGGDDRANVVRYGGLARTAVLFKPATLSAAAVAFSGALGVVGWDADGDLVAVDPATGLLRDTQSTGAARTFDLAAGRPPFVYGALSGRVVRYDAPQKALASFSLTGGADVAAVAPGTRPANPTGVWFASGGSVVWQPGEDPAAWTGAGQPVDLGAPAPPRVSALSAGGDGLDDLWAGTSASASERQRGSGLWFYESTLDPTTQQPAPTRPTGRTVLFNASTDGGIVHLAVETFGPFSGDAWVVVGDRLARVSRAVPAGAGARALRELRLPTPPGVTQVHAVGLSPGIKRRVALATDKGLAILE